jgi:hypothetical protein
MVFDVKMSGLGGGHVVRSKGSEALVVLKGSGWASYGRTNSGKELAKKHNFLRRGNEGHALGLGGGESDTLLKFAAPRDRATRHHRYEASTKAAINTIG